MKIPTDNRHEFEQWALSSGGVVEERDSSYLINLFDKSYIVCPKSDLSVTPCLVRDRMWEAWISMWLVNNLHEDTAFVDVGANCGYYSVLASRKCKTVLAYEPNPDYYSLLIETSRLNGWSFDVAPYAVSDSLGTAVLRIPGRQEGSASISADANFDDFEVRSVEVGTVTLDDLVISAHQDVMVKIDAESSEEVIWDGASKFRERYSPTFVIEYTPGVYSDDFIDKLNDYGDINYIDFDGKEIPIETNTLSDLKDWAMLVIRKRN